MNNKDQLIDIFIDQFSRQYISQLIELTKKIKDENKEDVEYKLLEIIDNTTEAAKSLSELLALIISCTYGALKEVEKELSSSNTISEIENKILEFVRELLQLENKEMK